MTESCQPDLPATILVVDDDKILQAMLVKMLKKDGYSLKIAANGHQAVLAFEQFQPDLVLLDAVMPVMDGFEACARIKTLPHGADTPVLIITALQDNKSVEDAFRAGATDFISKPIHWAVLRQRVRRLLAAKRAADALKASETLFRQVIHSISDHIYVTEVTAGGKNINRYVSPNTETLLGYPPEIIERDWTLWPSQLIHPDDRQIAAEHARNLSRGIDGEIEYRMIRADGEIIWVRDSGRVETRGDSKMIYGVVGDITERKRSEEALFSAQKLADLGTLAAGVAHEINSPLQVITGVSQSLQRRLNENRLEPEYLCRKLDVIHRNGWRCAEIVRSLRTYAHASAGQMEAHNLNEIINDTLLLTEHQLKNWSNISVVTDLAAELPLFVCDRNQMTQVIINLLTNARDAMPDGGQATLTTRYDESARQLLLQVSDTGVGMTELVKTKIFDPFFTTKEVDQGTGLGLSIIAGIVRAHSGTIAVDSRPGRGTTVTLRFKHREQPAPAGAAAIAAGGEGRFDDPPAGAAVVNTGTTQAQFSAKGLER
ncbi:MAG: response regulator [Chloroflexi bacterium]|nr:MAG: response regulator [Chloroflexota bacterium]